MKKILIIGAGFLQAFVIKRAKELGYYTCAVDGNKDAVGKKYADKFETISIIDEKACLEFAKKENINGVLTAATDYGVLTAAYIARELGLRGLDYGVAGLIKNKYRVRKRLYENGVDDTKQAYEVDENTDIAELSKK
ncbi:MAG: carbamoyl-phosphate synthase large subunit, partial [Clostridia bacterium]|nr:carbamoyl-phosphate synthase large subunit [Clostridia bacterium]